MVMKMTRTKPLFLIAFLLMLNLIPMAIIADPEPVKEFAPAYENWYNEDWLWRKSIAINGSSGAGTDYQVNLTVGYEAAMQADFDDLFFTDDDGTTPLDFWIEDYTASMSALVWVEVADDLGTDQDIFMYFGNDAVSTTSDGTATFQHFDDFTSDLLTHTGTTIQVTFNTLNWDSAVTYGDGEMAVSIDTNFSANFHFSWTLAPNVAGFLIALADTMVTSYYDYWDALIFRLYDDDKHMYLGAVTDGVNDAVEYDTTLALSTDYWGQMTYNGSIVTGDVYTDQYVTTVGTQVTRSFTYGNTLDVLSYATRDVAGCEGSMDYLFIRKFITSEPFVDSFSEAETNKNWNVVGTAVLVFNVPLDYWGLNMTLVFGGLLLMLISACMVAVKVRDRTITQDSGVLLLFLFCVGWGLFIGGTLIG